MVPDAPQLETALIVLVPLRVEHAVEMQSVLADPALGEFTGDTPPTLAELEARYRRQTRGHSPDGTSPDSYSPDGTSPDSHSPDGISPDSIEQWLNWVIAERPGNALVGFVQATVREVDARAELAWVVGTSWQGRGYASAAAVAVLEWLRSVGVREFEAHIHPANLASERVARRLGMQPTAELVDGERRWVRVVAATELVDGERR
ncbi:GNAT family N-acetyltransferase [Subtercola lobariae]|uniref:Acetyltransferase n=1 Tax=Subtercola lobariae TaxID=1588641 RepID=A0A917EVN9_9MICO|nr:GNAT family N-acetyltransferase [Subtercola lobariae]GGF18831.1 acetyltransferase [Subtercola lobariae]